MLLSNAMVDTITFNWFLIPLYVLLIIGFLWFVELIKKHLLWRAGIKAEEEMKNPAYQQKDTNEDWNDRRRMHWIIWRDTIIAQHNSRGVVIGLSATALAAFVGLTGSNGLTLGEFLLLIAASISILIQTILSLWESRNEREVAFSYLGDPSGRNKGRVTKSLFDNMIHPAIQVFTLLSLLLVLLLISHRAYRGVVSSQERVQESSAKTLMLWRR